MRSRTTPGTPNPVAGAIEHAVSIGDSQSGNFIRTFIHLGFNQDEQNRIVWDGAFPAHRRAADAASTCASRCRAAPPALYEAGQRRHGVVDALRRQDAWA